MWNNRGKATRVAALTAAAAILVGGTSSAGAFSLRNATRPVMGQSSAVGSNGGYAHAWVTYARASVTLPTQDTPSAPAVGASASLASQASAVSAMATPRSPTGGQPPTVVITRSAGSPTPVVRIDVPEKIEVPNVADVEPLPAAAIQQVETQLIDLPVPPVTGIAAKAAVLAFLQTTEVGALATLTAAETTALAGLDYAREQVILAFGDTDTPEEAAMLAKIDAFRAEVVQKFAEMRATLTAKFAQARAAVTAMDPADFEADAVEIVTTLTSAGLFVGQKLAEAQAALAAAMALFV